MIRPFYDCPRFKTCSVNNCPLDPEYPDRYTDSEDQQRQCTLGKIYRMRIAGQYPGVLKMEGMTKREYSAKKAWDDLPGEERARIIEKGKKSLKALGSQTEPEKAIVKGGGV